MHNDLPLHGDVSEADLLLEWARDGAGHLLTMQAEVVCMCYSNGRGAPGTNRTLANFLQNLFGR